MWEPKMCKLAWQFLGMLGNILGMLCNVLDMLCKVLGMPFCKVLGVPLGGTLLYWLHSL